MQRRTRPKKGRTKKTERRSDWQGALSISPSLRLPFYPPPEEDWEGRMKALLSAIYSPAKCPPGTLEFKTSKMTKLVI